MSRSPSPSSWPAWLLFALLVVGPPSALVAFLPAVTTHPLVAGGFLVVYEGLIGLGIIVNTFAKKIWERRGDAWADASAGRLEMIVRLLFAGASRRYKMFFQYEYSDLDMKGISTRGTYTLDLEQVFVEVSIDPTPAHQASTDPIRLLPSALRSGTHDIWDYLTLLDQHLVILGPPGSGKTTLLKHLGLRLLQSRHQHQTRAKRLPWTVPLLLPLREHSSLLSEQYGLVEAANNQIKKWKQAIPPEWIERQLHKGSCLVLLDGLDEIADTIQRQQMVDWVQQQMLTYPKNRFVITSRPLGYQRNPLDRVTVLEVQPFTFEQVTQFLSAWYCANEIKRAVRDDPGVRMRANAGAEDLLKRLRASSALFAMAVNPLLLTMIATVHLYYGKLPGARITLYKAICEVFLSRRAEIPNSPQELRAEQRQLVLQVLAYTFMQQGKREMVREEVYSILAAPLQLVSQTLTPQDFLKHLEAITSGLLLEREQEVYSFAHQTFQEYLAMMHIQEHHLEHELPHHVGTSWWHETILLFCAQADATAILEACINQSQSLEALTLAVNCAEEARTVKAEVKERLYALLDQVGEDTRPERKKVIAEALLKRRLQRMHPLQDIVFVDTSLVTGIEYQLFLDEQRIHGHYATPDLWNKATFPQGHGSDALLGVGLEDAKAFCRWLTERDREGQSYRLPRREEWQQIQRAVGAGLLADTSYWEEDGFVVWSHGSPSRSLQEHVLKALIDSFTSVNERASEFAHARAIVSDLKVAYTRDLALAKASDLANVLSRTIANASASASTLASDLASASTNASTSASDLASDLALANARANARALARARSRTRVRARVRARDLANASASARDLASASARARARARASVSASDRSRAIVSELEIANVGANVLANVLASASNLTLASDLVNVSASASELAGELTGELTSARARAGSLASSLASTPASSLASLLASELANTLACAFEIYLILFLFVYRPKGMFPAYEGILLIKERTRDM